MKKIIEGSLYKTLDVGGNLFHIYYGYNSDSERERWEPTPIFPDFTKTPVYTERGSPHARADQDVCDHYKPKKRVSGEKWCNDCVFFTSGEELIGICACEKRKNSIRKNE